MKRIAAGFFIYFQGMRLWTKHRKLLTLSIIPFALDFLCLAFGLYFAASKIPEIVKHLVSIPHVWYQYLVYYAAIAVTALSLFFVVFFAVFVIANLLAFPFNDLLAERTLLIAEALPEHERSLKAWYRKSRKNLESMVKKTIILLIVGTFVFLATLIPGLGLIAALISVFLMAFDRVDYSFDHYQWAFKQRLSFVKNHFPEMIGFAAALGLTTAIPVFNMLAMPGSVVAGAALVAHLLKKNPVRENSSERTHPQAAR